MSQTLVRITWLLHNHNFMEEESMYVTDIIMNYLASVEEEEKYRLQALDNSLGHVAVKVKEQIDDKDSGVSSHIIYSNKDVSSGILGGTLIQSMIHAATRSTILKENIKKLPSIFIFIEISALLFFNN